ncbi:MAG: hypothetical protein AAGJ40_24485, partial [Planctomycetota bacterium]
AEFVTLVSNYEFGNSFSDLLGNGSDLVPIGSGSMTAGGFFFGDGDGLSLDTNLTSGDYLIELDVTFANLDGWDKLIDFENRLQDEGLYVNPTANLLNLYSYSETSNSSVLVNTPYTI